jgi:serine/threonine-protein kinase
VNETPEQFEEAGSPWDETKDDWTGEQIGEFQLAEKIGQGGMAIVHRAYQSQLDRWVAIKILQATEATGEEFLTRFRREARAIAALRHPNILTVYDYGEENGVAYIVMEYVPGGTLKAQLTGDPWEWPDAATLTIPVGQALAYAHSQGIVHRDVKPANILLARPDWPLLADFGLAKLIGRWQRITKPGASMGTPDYLAPEQAIGEDVDHRSDIYGLGVVLYELLTGHLPFEAESPTDRMLWRLYEPPVRPGRINPRIAPALEAIIMRALARQPEDRYPTMDALVHDLAQHPGAPGQFIPSTSSMAQEPSTTSQLDTPSPATGPRLIVSGTAAVLVLPPKEEILIGRLDPRLTPHPDVDLGPHGGAQAGASRHHARLLCRPEGWLLEDLQSTNGTFLNDVPVPPGKPVRICSGDVIRCSRMQLVFHEE